jgi:hypothetical protein
MCASCGCGIPEETHGDKRNILYSQVTAAAKAMEISENDVVNNIHAMVHASHKIDQKPKPDPLRDKDLKAAAKDLGKEITAELLKGSRRDETGKFHPGQDNTHSHRMGEEIVTHTHDGEKTHQHPARHYGPSFHHR